MILHAQNAKETFGKNKVQYSDDQYDWWMYETNNFISYWYGKSKSVAKFCIEIAESENQQVQRLFEYHLKDKIELIIYADHSDASQSNISLNDFQFEKNWDQEPKIKGQKMILYFDGDHNKLRAKLREGIIKMYLSSMFDGTAFQDAVQKVISLKLPDWFEYGLTMYLNEGWSSKSEEEFYEKWKHNSFKKFSKKEFKLAGLSFWNYLSNNYGQQVIPNWLYMTRIQKDIYEACQLVLNQDFEQLEKDWYSYYLNLDTKTYEQGRKTSNIPLHLKKEEEICSIYPSIDDTSLTIATNQLGIMRIRQVLLATGKTTRLFKYGYKSKLNRPDVNYPIFCPKVNQGTNKVIFEKRNRVYIKILSGKGSPGNDNILKLPEDIQRVYHGVQKNDRELFLVAYINGATRLILYSIKSRQYTFVNNDSWDKLNLEYKADQKDKCILFTNRPNNDSIINESNSVELLNPFYLFELQLDEKDKSKKIKPLLDSGTLIKKWIPFKEGIFVQKKEDLSENWYVLDREMKPKRIQNTENAEWVFSGNDAGTIFLIKKIKGKYIIHKEFLTLVSLSISEKQISERVSYNSLNNNMDTLNDYHYFQSTFGNPSNIQDLYQEFNKKTSSRNSTQLQTENHFTSHTVPTIQAYKPEQAIAYRNRFKIEELSCTLNNDLLFSGLNTYTGRSSEFNTPELGILFKTHLLDILENHAIESGIRIPTTFNGLEAYILYENRIKRVDANYALYFKTTTESFSASPNLIHKLQTNTWLVNHQLKYPIDHYRSLRLNSTLRSDHQFYLATNRASLEDSTDRYQQRIGFRLEYIFDNALDLSLNLKTQTQLKVFFETSKRFALNTQQRSTIYPGFLFLAGFDARHHIPVFGRSSFSNRAYSLISFGKERILQHVGGTENWLVPKYASTNPLETSGEYVYSSLTTEVRGYEYGSRKASSVFGISSELRIPIFQYLLQQNWKNNLLKNFLLIGFFDAAVVWDGFLPEVQKSSTATYHAENPVVKIDLQYKTDPWISSSGLGLRTSLLGYYVRLDYAWKIEASTFKEPKWIFSLGLDF